MLGTLCRFLELSASLASSVQSVPAVLAAHTPLSVGLLGSAWISLHGAQSGFCLRQKAWETVGLASFSTLFSWAAR